MKNIVFGPLVCMVALLGCEKQRENAVEAAKDTGIQGKSYFAKCSVNPVVGLATGLLTGESLKSSRIQLNFAGANVTRSTMLYPTQDCNGNAAFTFKEKGRFEINETKKTEEGASLMDLSVECRNPKKWLHAATNAARALGADLFKSHL